MQVHAGSVNHIHIRGAGQHTETTASGRQLWPDAGRAYLALIKLLLCGLSGACSAVRLSEDHKPHPNVCPREITRICEAGGCVLWGRVQVRWVGLCLGCKGYMSRLFHTYGT